MIAPGGQWPPGAIKKGHDLITIQNCFNTAIVFSEEIDPGAAGLLRALCGSPISQNSKIRVMPDVHAGKGCAVGMTMTISDCVAPGLIGIGLHDFYIVQIICHERARHIGQFVRGSFGAGVERSFLVEVRDPCAEIAAPGVDNQPKAAVPALVHFNKVIAAAKRPNASHSLFFLDMAGTI